MNNFSGIINNDLKNLFNNAISSLLYDDALTIPCTLYYGVTKYEDCSNCVFDPIGNKSSNRFQDGGPVPFPFGSICPMCGGNGKKGLETSENINLMVIWDYKQFMDVGTVNNPAGTIQVMTFATNTPALKRAKELIVATDIGAYGRHRYQRLSEPQPCGWGNSPFISCLWEKSG